MHKLDEKTLITPALIRRFQAEASEHGDGRFCAWIQTGAGQFLSHNIGPEAEAYIQQFCLDVMTAANRSLHHDGAWVVMVTQAPPMTALALGDAQPGDYREIIVLWMDKDGDVQLPIHIQDDEDFFNIFTVPLTDWLESLETGWQEWNHMMNQVLDRKQDQTFKRAQGQAPTAPSSELVH